MKTLQSSACNRLRVPFLVAGFFFIIQYGYSQASFRSIASGDWDSATTWEITSGTDGDNVPDGDDNVTIEAGHTITVGQPAFASSVTLNGDGGLLVLNADLTVGGDVLIDAPGVNATTNQITVGDFTLTIGGSLTINGANTNRKAILSIGSGLVDVKDNVTINNNANAEVSFVGNGRLRVAGVFTKGANSIFNVGTGTVELSGAAQTVPAINYHNLVLSGSGVKTLSAIAAGAWTLGGSLTLSGTVSTTTVDDAIINGDLNIGDGTTFTAAGFGLTVIGATNVGDGTSGTFAMATSVTGDKIFNGLITIATGATWNNPINEDPFIRGGITNNGTFNSGNATAIYTFDGSDQALTGTISIQAVTVTGITLTNNNSFTVVSFLNGTGTVRQAAGSTLTITGTSSSIGLDATTFTPNTVNYNGATQPIIGANYWDLNISGSGVKTWQAGTNSIGGNLTLSGTPTTTTTDNLAIHGNLNIGDGATLTAAGFNFSVSGTATIGAGTSGALNFISTAGTKTFLGLVTVNANGTWNNSGEDMTFEASIINNGNFNAGSGLYSFINNPQSLTGTFSIPNILVDGITLTNNGTVGVSTNLNGTGTWIQGGGTSLNIGSIISINTLDATAAGNTVQYSGGNQTVFPTTYNNLTIAQSSGQAFPGGDITVNGTLALNGGNFNLIGSNVLTLEASAAVTGTFSNTRMIIATSGSEVRKVFNAPGSFVFPIGDNTGGNDYSPITVTANAGTFGTPYIGVSVVDAKHPNNASATHFLSRYWNVTHTGITDVDIVATYVTADVTGTEGSIKAAQLDGAFSQLTNPWVKDVALDEPNNELEFTGAVLTDGQTSVFTGITSTDPLVTINGGDVTICAGNSVVLDASVTGGDPTIIYSWDPAAGLSATTIANPTATPGLTTLYTITVRDGNGIVASDNTTITVDPAAPVANAGPDQTLCNTGTFTLAGNTAAPGTGVWSIQSGPGAVTTPGLSNSTITGVTAGAVPTVVRWTISNGVCGSTFDEVTLVNLLPSETADGGDDITQCNTSTFTLNAVVPTIGVGTWSLQSGTATITNTASATTTVTGIASGTSATVRWTVSNGGCDPTFEDIILTNTAAAPVANAGPDQTLCNTGTFTLAGNTAAPGTGVWSIQSGPGAVTTPGLSNSTITGVTAGAVPTVVRWTISNGVCGSTFDEVTLVNLLPSETADGGDDITQCNTSTFTLNAVVPTIGVGTWSLQSGTATITNTASATTTVTGIASGTSATVRWTVSNGGCDPTFEDIILTNTAAAPVANAGPDQTLCNTGTFTLAGNTAAPGTGVWSIQSGPGAVTTPGLSNSTITGVTAGAVPTVVRWTISNGVCGSTFDEVTLVNLLPSETADGGDDITQCNTSTFTLNAVVPTIGVGTWSLQSGTATITNTASATTTVTGIASGTSATVRWTVSNGGCDPTFEDIILTNTAAAPVANAGPDQTLCNTGTFTLAGNTAAPGTGVWSIQSGPGAVTTPGLSNSTITGVTAGAVPTVVRWTISNGVCGSTFDEVTLVNLLPSETADGGDDITQCNTSTFTLNAVVPTIGVGTWSLQSGTATITNTASATTTVTGIASGTSATVRWTVSNGGCDPTFEDIILTNTAAAPVANAGPDQTLCNTGTFTLAGNTAAPGTGVWSIQSGPGAVTTPGLSNSTITGVTAGAVPTVVRWTISNGVCGSTFDEVTLVNLLPSETADGGDDITQCNTSTFTLNAVVPTIGVGTWSLQSGTATITNTASATTTVTGIASGTSATVRWTVSNGGCDPTFEDIILTNTAAAPVANAGPDQTLCNTGTFTLAGNTAAPGTGVWSIQSGPGAVTTPGLSNSTITGVTAGAVPTVVRWTISNGVCGSTFDEVTLVNLLPSETADGGDDITQCNTSTFTLNAVVPTIGVGTWSLQSGTATITNTASATTTVTGIASGTSATVRWTVSNGGCDPTFEDIILTNTAAAPVANAGPDQTLCNTGTFTLAGNTAAPGTGVWSIQSGPGAVTTPGLSNSTITGVTAGAVPTVVRWTISNGVCGSTFDEVTLVNLLPSETADGGDDITQCNTSTFTLNAVVPTIGVGTWSLQSGTATITNTASATTTVTGIASGTSATVRWTVSNGGCDPTFEDIILTNTAAAPVANAGPDQTLCNTGTFTLAGNTAAPGTGVWSIQSGPGAVTTPGLSNSTITGVTAGAVPTVVRWTISNGVCGSTFDEVTLVNLLPSETADGGDDITQCNTSTFTLNAVVPTIGVGTWSLQSGTATITNTASATTTVTGIASGTSATVRWTVSNGGCDPTFEDIILTNTAAAPVANAGPDQTLCNTGTFTLAGNTAAPGTGVWSIQSGPGAVTTPGLSNSTITGVTAGAVPTVVRWTISNGVCGSTFDEVTLVNLLPSETADGGDDITQCNTSTFTLNAVVPTIGVGTWSLQSGTATITNTASATTTVTGIASGTSATVRWTVSNGGCDPTFEDIILTNTAAAPVANAGPDQTLCNTGTFTLAGNTAAPGTGVWSIQSGPGAVTTPGLSNSTITGVTAGAVPTVVRWTISNGVCGSTFDEVTLVNLLPSETADGGDDITQCNTSTFTLNAVVPTIGVGTWSLQSGTATITNTASATTTVTGIASGTSATVRWTVSNGGCDPTFEDIILTNTAAAPVANAGPDQTLCNTGTFTLAGNTAAPGTGVWSIQSGPGAVTTPGLSNSTITGVTAGAVPTVVRWTISNGVCGSTFDEVTLVNLLPSETADGGDDITQCNTSTFTLNAVVPTIGVGTWSLQSGTATITNTASATTTVTGIASGTSATVRWTVSNGGCDPTFEDIILTNTAAAPVANAGPDQTLCNTGTFTLAGNTAAPGTGVWSIQSGPGAVTTPGLSNSTITGVTAGAVPTVVRWTISNGVCGSTFDEVTLVNNLLPVVDAGSNSETCEGVAFNFATQSILATASNYSSISWTHSGTGTLFNANTLTPTYQPGAGELGLVNFMIEANGVAPCSSVSDLMTLTITQSPTVTAGSDDETCQGVSYNFSAQTTPSNATNYTSILWTHTGSGVLTNSNTLTPSYTPGVGETGAKTFTLTAVGNGSCANVSDQMILTITPSPVVSAGSNAETCQGVSYNFNNQSVLASASNYNSIAWTTLGTGVLSNANTLTPTYAPGVGETGNITFTLTAYGNGSCTSVNSQMTLMITPSPTVNAGSDAETCQGVSYNFSTQSTPASATNYLSILWTTSGTGVLSNANSLTPSYTPGIGETGNVLFTLRANGNGSCVFITDQMTLVITPSPTVNAGSNAETCQGVSYNFSSQGTPASATNYASISWTHSGTGTLFNANTLTPTYQPGPTEAGNVTFTLTAVGKGTCVSVDDQMTLVITPAPIVSAGSDSETCQGVAFNFASQITGASGSNYSSLLWIHTGTGALANSNSLAPTYTSGVGETGPVTFTLTANGNGSCLPVNNAMILTITPASIVDAGSDEEICQGGAFNFSNQSILASASNFSSLAWTHDGAGTLFNGNTLTPTYFATPGETGVRTFTLKAFPNGTCSSTNSTMLLTITPAPVANAGSDDAVCEGTPTFDFSTRFTVASIANGTLVWTHNGAGFLSSNSVLNPVYTVGAGDFGNTVTFTLTVTSGSTVCAAAVDQFLLQVNRTALVSVPSPNIVVCEPAQINLSGSFGGSASSGAWSLLAGGGTLSVSSITGVNVTAVYDTVRTDVGNTLQFRLTSNDPDGTTGPCTEAFVDMNVTIDESAKVFAGNDFAVCEYDNINLNGSFSGSTTSVVWSGGSGAPQFGDVTSPITTYNLTPAERAANGHIFTFTLTTDDPAGVCPSVSDQVRVTVNDTLNFVTFTGLDVVYQEDDQTETLVGVPGGGVFTGPGIVAGTAVFNPANANIGTNHIKYTYTDPLTGCLSAPRASTIVNPVTTIDFRVLVSVSPDVFAAEDVNGFPQICSDIGDIRLRGIPDVNDPLAGTPTEFSSPQPTLDTRIIQKPDGFYYIVTDGLPAGVYNIIYTYTNEFGATTFFQKLLTVYSSPRAIIDVSNSCVSSELNFTESSVVTGSNPTGATITDWVWNFGNGIGSSIQEPFYQYPVPGNYNVVLQVTTSEGCKHDTLKAIRVGPTPTMNFVWSAFCNGNDTKFVDATNPGISTITEYTWEFSDGFTLTGPAGTPVPAGTNGGRTSGTYTNPNHRYDTFGQYDVKLTVSTNDGCVNDTTKRAFILSYGTPSPTAGYFENFESGPGTWVGTRADISIPTDTSWVFGLPGGTVINSASSGTNAWWTGRNTNTITNKSTYFANEKSAVIGPCINLSNIKRPMISIDYWSDSEDGRDGAVVQFSTNGGVTWQTIGNDAGAGLRWYDGRALTGNPGLQPLGQFGWSTSNYTTGGWKTARYNLDQIPKVDREEVIFRVAFGSNNDNQFNDPLRTIEYSGFAFDNVFIGEKQRNVLVEYFTNAGINPSANDYLNNLYSNQFVLKDSSDFFKIQYHIANPSSDLINQGNPVDPAARSLFYGISQPPVGIMDGVLGNYFGTVFNGDQTKINATEVDRRALESPLFDIEVNELAASADSISLAVQFEYIDAATPLNTPVTFLVGLIESNVSGNINVLRKMLLGSEGKTVNIPWTLGTATTVPVKSIIDVPIGVANNNLWIVAFVQDRNTKRIHQSVMVKASQKSEATVVGVEDPVLEGANRIEIFPNPASRQLNFTSEHRLMEGYTYTIVDQRGVTMLKGELREDIFTPQQVELNNLTNGVYFVIISRGGRALVHRKVAVMNQR